MFCITGYHSESLNILPYRLPQLTFRYSTLWPMGYLIYSSYTLPYSYLSLLYSTVHRYLCLEDIRLMRKYLAFQVQGLWHCLRTTTAAWDRVNFPFHRPWLSTRREGGRIIVLLPSWDHPLRPPPPPHSGRGRGRQVLNSN